MKFTAKADSILWMLSMVGKIIPKKTMTPIVTNFYFKNVKGVLYVTASDGNTFITAPVPTAVVDKKDKGVQETLIPADVLIHLLETMEKEQDLAFVIDDVKAEISWENGSAKVPTFDAKADYPQEIPVNAEDASFFETKIDAKDAARAIASTLAARDDHENLRQVLNTIAFDFKTAEGESVAVATDANILAVAKLPVTVEKDYLLLLPGDSVRVFTSLLGSAVSKKDGEEETKTEMFIRCDSSRVQMIAGVFDFRCGRVNGKFPDWKKIMPKASETPLTIARTEFMNSIKRISSAMGKDSAKLILELHGNTMKTIIKDDAIKSNIQESLDFCDYAGDDIEIVFRCGNLLRLLGLFKCDDVTLHFTANNKPVLIKAANDAEDDVVGLIGPIPK